MIAGEKPGAKQFWSLYLIFRPTPVGGCQQIVNPGDQVLFAYAHASDNDSPTMIYLRLYGPKDAVVPSPVTLTATDGKGAPIKDAKFTGYQPKTDAYGKVTISFGAGTHKLIAWKEDNWASIRSNEVVLVVKAPNA